VDSLGLADYVELYATSLPRLRQAQPRAREARLMPRKLWPLQVVCRPSIQVATPCSSQSTQGNHAGVRGGMSQSRLRGARSRNVRPIGYLSAIPTVPPSHHPSPAASKAMAPQIAAQSPTDANNTITRASPLLGQMAALHSDRGDGESSFRQGKRAPSRYSCPSCSLQLGRETERLLAHLPGAE
jgi:hypothetical protein